MKKVYFQIGTNDGNDLFRDMVKDEKPDIVILVEPNTSLIDNIKKNYNNIENVYIYNNAIYYNNELRRLLRYFIVHLQLTVVLTVRIIAGYNLAYIT